MAEVTLYGTQLCPFCRRAEQLLKNKGVTDLKKIAVDLDPGQREIMTARTGRRSVPQIFIGEAHVGAYDDLAALDREGRLDEMLRPTGAARP